MDNDFTTVPKHYAARDHEKMKEVLLAPDAAGPSVHYYMIRGGSDQRNITVWEPGTVGNEFVKTYGHYHVGKLEETYWVLLGQGFALSQKRAVDESGQALDDKLEFFKVQSVQAGDSLHFESGEGHLFVNSGRTYLVTADDSPVHFDDPDPSGLPGHADYLPVQTMRGFAYYVVEHEGSPALVKNPRYSSIEREDLGNIPVLS